MLRQYACERPTTDVAGRGAHCPRALRLYVSLRYTSDCGGAVGCHQIGGAADHESAVLVQYRDAEPARKCDAARHRHFFAGDEDIGGVRCDAVEPGRRALEADLSSNRLLVDQPSEITGEAELVVAPAVANEMRAEEVVQTQRSIATLQADRLLQRTAGIRLLAVERRYAGDRHAGDRQSWELPELCPGNVHRHSCLHEPEEDIAVAHGPTLL